MLPTPTPGTFPMIRYVFDGSIAFACLTLLGLALCSPL
jgi:hypothetical protein